MTSRFKKFCGALFILVATAISTSCNTAKHDQMPSVSAKEISLPGKYGPAQFSIEIADTQEERARGLMEREYMPDDHGMLFVFDTAARHQFWMKNTPMSLDLIYFDDDWRVVGIVESTTPYSLRTFQIDRDARYVLEVKAGMIRRHGINVNSTGQLS